MEHNGWSNYPTWHTYMMMTNDEETEAKYEDMKDEVKSNKYFYEDGVTKRLKVNVLANKLKEDHNNASEEFIETLPFWAIALYQFGFDSVNWNEIAEFMLVEVEE